MRPKQWVKNSFCLAPLIFSRRADDLDAVAEAGLVFAAFSLLASSIYLLNDVIDRERDRAHPVKCKRPIASGALPVPLAIVASVLLAAGALVIAFYQSWVVLGVFCAYLLQNFGYTFWLKHVVLVDLFIIAIGFVLRVMAGAGAIEVSPSHWILTCTLFLSLLLAALKRRAEVEQQGADKGTRKVLSSYSTRYLDLIVAVVAGGAILSYALYTMSPETAGNMGTTDLIFTLPFVVFAIFRYIYLVLEQAKGESPFELLVRDVAMMITIAGFTVVTVLVVYVL